MRTFGPSLEVGGWRDRAQSLSSINILVSPCSRTPQSPAQMDSSLDKVRLETAASLPLLSSSRPPGSSSSLTRKSLGGVFPSPAHPEPAAQPPSCISGCRVQPSAEDKQNVETMSSRADTSYRCHSNNTEEQFLLGDDRVYPTLRSKSLSENPRKTKRKDKDEDTLRSSTSARDLTETLQSRTGGPGGAAQASRRTGSPDHHSLH